MNVNELLWVPKYLNNQNEKFGTINYFSIIHLHWIRLKFKFLVRRSLLQPGNSFSSDPGKNKKQKTFLLPLIRHPKRA